MFHRLKRILAAAVLLLLADPGWTAEKPDDRRMSQLIARLGSSQFDEREAASRELHALGPAALPALKLAIESEDAEVRRRARKLVQRLEQALTAVRWLEPRPVRIVYQDTPIPEAVADLARKTGFPLRLSGDVTALAKRRLTIDTGETSFWDALAQFCRKAGLTEHGLDPAGFPDDRQESTVRERRIVTFDRTSWESFSRTNGPLILAEGAWKELPSCHASAIRIRALPPGTPAHHVSRAEGETLVVLEALPEPHLQWQGVFAVRVDRAIDEKDRALKQRVVATGFGAGVGREAEEIIVIWDGGGEFPVNPFGDGRHVPIRFRLADGPSRTLKELRGTMAAQVRTPPEPMAVVGNIREAAGQLARTADACTLQVVEVKRTEEGPWRIRLTLTAPPPELVTGSIPARLIVLSRGWWWGRGSAISLPEHVDFALLDAEGRRFAMAGGEAQGTLTSGISHTYTLLYQPPADQAPPVRLLCTSRRTVRVELPFTLKDVPLP